MRAIVPLLKDEGIGLVGDSDGWGTCDDTVEDERLSNQYFTPQKARLAQCFGILGLARSRDSTDDIGEPPLLELKGLSKNNGIPMAQMNAVESLGVLVGKKRKRQRQPQQLSHLMSGLLATFQLQPSNTRVYEQAHGFAQ